MNPFVELRGITKRYAVEDAPYVLKNINMNINRGDFLALMGASGSGKTTLMNIIGLLDIPTDGEYLIDGCDVSKMNDKTLSHTRNKRIGFIFQSFYLIPYLSVLDNVLLPKIYTGERIHGTEKFAMNLLERFGMVGKAKSRPRELSGGQQQRVAIARALVNSPDLILADEPTGQLDSATSEIIMKCIASLPESGTAVLLVTHDQFTASFAQRVVRIKDGILE
jgi:ABC-type lipoprotein export system ATPase subunit